MRFGLNFLRPVSYRWDVWDSSYFAQVHICTLGALLGLAVLQHDSEGICEYMTNPAGILITCVLLAR
jgi:hypothetical protein